jgi:hypothetical protein
LRVLISWTEARAASGLAQNPGSACWASSALSRAALPDRSKKISEFGDSTLEFGEAIDEFGHARLPEV